MTALELASPSRVPSRSARVAVVGGGITGVTTAYALLRHGHDVTLIERHPYPAMETSYANGGQLSASNAEVWNRLATVGKGLKWMVTPGAPLLVRPAPSWQKVSWMAAFLRAIPGYEDATVSTVRLAIEARGHLLRIAEEEGIAFDLERRGILHFFKSDAAVADAARVTDLLAKGGLHRRAVSPEEIAEIEPALHGEIVGGTYTDSDFTGDVHAFSNALAYACVRRGGTLRLGREVASIAHRTAGVTLGLRSTHDTDGDLEYSDFAAVVICGGVGSRKLAAMAGDRVPVYPVKGYSLTVHLTTEEDRRAAPWVSLLDDDAKIVTSRLGPDRYRIAGTAEIAGEDRDIRHDRTSPLVGWVHRHHPGLSTRDMRTWAGLRPMMPDMLPRVAPGRMPGIFYNTGHGHLGWTLSAATAEVAAGQVSEAVSV